MSIPDSLRTPFRSSTDPNAEQVFVFSQLHIDQSKGNIVALMDPHGPTRLAVVLNRAEKLEEHIYTHTLLVDPGTSDEQALAWALTTVSDNLEDGSIVWRGHKGRVHYAGPPRDYTPPGSIPTHGF